MLTQEQRDTVEEALYSAHLAADQYLNKPRPMYEKLLKISVNEALSVLENLKSELADDPKVDNYKLHLFVPLQMHHLLEMRKETKNAE